jgi:hypothetical protein
MSSFSEQIGPRLAPIMRAPAARRDRAQERILASKDPVERAAWERVYEHDSRAYGGAQTTRMMTVYADGEVRRALEARATRRDGDER